MRKSLFALLAMFIAMSASAQDSLRLLPVGFKLSGYADVYYKYGFNENKGDNKTSFTNSHNSFELGMVSLKLESTFKNVGIVADLGFGKRAEDFSYNDEKTRLAIKQLYISYAPTSWLKFTMGSFATHVGYELVDAYANRNYSMSYMFSYGPFFHTGAKADLTFGEHNLMIGVFNPTDLKSAWDGHEGIKYIGAQYGFASASVPFKAYLNYIGGLDTFQTRNDQLDLVLSYQVAPKFGIGYNGTYSTYKNKPAKTDATNWFGSALYFNYDPSESFGLTLRGEYFSDKDGLKVYTDATEFPEGGSIMSFTLSGNYRIGGFTLIPEFRLDQGNKEGIFHDKDDAPKKSSASVSLAAIYKF